MASKKKLKEMNDNQAETIILLKRESAKWEQSAREYRENANHNYEHGLKLKESLHEMNEHSTELHLDNHKLNAHISSQVSDMNAMHEYIEAQNRYISYMMNR